MNKDSRAFWKKLLSNRLSALGLIIIGLTCISAILAVPLSPDRSPDANAIQLPLAAKKPGFQVQVLQIPDSIENSGSLVQWFSGIPEQKTEIPILDYDIQDNGIWITHYAEEAADGIREFIPKTRFPEGQIRSHNISWKKFWLGTDRFGRDMLSRMLLGARVSIAVGMLAVFISMIVGIILGALAAYYGGGIDKVIQWLMNVIWSLPTLLLVIAFALALGKGLWQIFIAIGLSMWVDVARLVRGQVLSLKEKEFVEAARVLGLPDWQILFKHILPNLIGPLTVVAAANFASAILLEAGLSFLGLGVQAPAPSWGQMIKEHYGYIVLDSAYLAIIPGIAIMLLVMSFNFVGNGLRDALDVKLK
ncbi:MAG: ABC transporter permease subunit [Bacteroidetes bacterium]|nr:ABC transporter permease subunit [Bacteroidota bacterium]